MPRRLASALVFLLAAARLLEACAPETRTLGLPVVEGMAAGVLFAERIEGDGSAAIERAVAFDAAAPDDDLFGEILLVPDDEVRYAVRLTALYFRSAPQNLKFGPLVPAASGELLPAHDEAHLATIENGEASAWEPAGDLPASIRDYRYTQ